MQQTTAFLTPTPDDTNARTPATHQSDTTNSQSTHPTTHFGSGASARLWAACRDRERIMVEFIDGATLVGTAEPAPRGSNLILLSPRHGCSPIAVSTAHITYVGPASALAP